MSLVRVTTATLVSGSLYARPRYFDDTYTYAEKSVTPFSTCIYSHDYQGVNTTEFFVPSYLTLSGERNAFQGVPEEIDFSLSSPPLTKQEMDP